MADRTVIVRLQAEINQFKSAMGQAGASVAAVGAATTKVNAASVRSWSDLNAVMAAHPAQMKKIGLAGGIAAAAIGYFGFTAVQAASSLNESMSKSIAGRSRLPPVPKSE